MIHNQARTVGGAVMPLLMGFTQPTKIETLENEQPIVYDPITQSVVYDMRTVGTKSLKISTTQYVVNRFGQKSAKSDKKNEIDDSKTV